jgi:ribosomal protein L9
MLLPPNIDFYRTPIVSPPQRHSPSIPASSAVSVAAQDAIGPQGQPKTSIYGSVTTADIAENLKAILAEDDRGARVVLTPEEITFVETTEETDRVKHLGIFEINIRVKGATDDIRRTIKVNAQE